MFYLGKLFDPNTQTIIDQPLRYDPNDLTTHAVCVGMTGSGKTGLCVTLLEEAALAGLPAIVIDPKGDIANLLLQFPDLRPEDFQPWVNMDEARRARLSIEAYAAQTAERWRAGLAQWGLGPADIARLKEAVDWAIYTPGSDAGRPLSILKSLERPDLPWDENQELLRERIAGICSGLLGLIGVQADPVKSREHILLANIFEHAWKNDLPLDLAELITQVQTPPFEKLGVFEVDRFYPEADRLKLALDLNAIVAAPSFQAWITGEPLDITALLHTPDTGKPRIAILYVAHLSEAERMFFITLLLEQVVAWLRGQSGTTSLRGLLYFDEVYGYFPPYPFNPPSKVPLMRLLKQARAFGLGVMLVTQNPGDLDYKGLTNTGTWFIGKLQTERDKARLLEGLETIASQSRAALPISQLDALISSLAPRQFLLNNVHQDGPVVFHTRWAMSYLAGPLTRDQIRVFKPEESVSVEAEARPTSQADAERPPTETRRRPRSTAVRQGALPSTIPQYFLPIRRTLEEAVAAWREGTGNQRAQFGEEPELIYRPVLVAQAVVRYVLPKAQLNTDRRFTYMVPDSHTDTPPHWLDYEVGPVQPGAVERAARPGAGLRGEVPAAFTDPKRLAAWQKDLVSYLYRTADMTLHQNIGLKLYARPGQSYAEFVVECQQAAERKLQDEVQAIRARYDKQLDRLEDRLLNSQRALKEDREQLRAREAESRWTGIENIVGVVLGYTPYRPMSTQASRDRMAKKARTDVEQGEETVERLQAQMDQLKREAQAAFQASKDKWHGIAQDIKELRVTPRRSDILVELFGIGWQPFWVVDLEGMPLELAAH